MISTRRGPAVASAVIVAAAAFVAASVAVPLRSLAYTPGCACTPNAVLPESPLGAAFMLVAAVACLAVVTWLRRRRGVALTVLPVLAVVALFGVAVGGAVAAADTACTCNPTVGGVLGITTGAGDPTSGSDPSSAVTPYTGADIPWLTAAIIIVGGTIASLIARPRRRSRASR